MLDWMRTQLDHRDLSLHYCEIVHYCEKTKQSLFIHDRCTNKKKIDQRFRMQSPERNELIECKKSVAAVTLHLAFTLLQT